MAIAGIAFLDYKHLSISFGFPKPVYDRYEITREEMINCSILKSPTYLMIMAKQIAVLDCNILRLPVSFALFSLHTYENRHKLSLLMFIFNL
jgi:hypothetical protein